MPVSRQSVCPHVMLVVSLADDCRYSPPGLRLPSPEHWPVPNYTAQQGRHHVLRSVMANSDDHIGPNGIPCNMTTYNAGNMSQHF